MDLEDIKIVGVVGSGVMGHGIGLSFALHGYPTIMSDVSEEVLRHAMARVRATADMFVDEGLATREQANGAVGRISTTTDLAELAAASDFVTEAIVERSQDKRDLFNELDRQCLPHTIIVSNTSGLVLSDFASDVSRQDKIAITHYFAPPEIVPGVEVAKGPGTSDETIDMVYDLMLKIDHIPIRVLKELPGYLLNRLQGAMYREAIRLWAEGVATAEDIDLGVRTTFGFRMPNEGPFTHYDMSGIWRWPKEVKARAAKRRASGNPEISAESAEKIRRRLEEGRPWFFDPEEYDEALAGQRREFARRYKDMYRPGSGQKRGPTLAR